MPFYLEIRPSPEIARGYVHLLDAVDIYMAKGMPAQAERVRVILREMWARYGQLEASQPVKADEYIRGRIRATAVRPQSNPGATTGALERGIRSRAIPSQWNLAGIGVADLDELDRVAVNARGGVYWRTQEYGYAGNVGRRIRGYFADSPTGGNLAAPNQGDFRVHPYFLPAARGPRMLIRRPINARHFLRDGTAQFIHWRDMERARIKRAAIASLTHV